MSTGLGQVVTEGGTARVALVAGQFTDLTW
jgi:hypothetical protein